MQSHVKSIEDMDSLTMDVVEEHLDAIQKEEAEREFEKEISPPPIPPALVLAPRLPLQLPPHLPLPLPRSSLPYPPHPQFRPRHLSLSSSTPTSSSPPTAMKPSEEQPK
jgi:hypothetical protein